MWWAPTNPDRPSLARTRARRNHWVFASPRHAVIADSFRWQWFGADNPEIHRRGEWEHLATYILDKSVRRVHVTGSIIWSNKKDFDPVQSRLEPRPFVCSSQLLPEIGNARHAALCRRNQTKVRCGMCARKCSGVESADMVICTSPPSQSHEETVGAL